MIKYEVHVSGKLNYRTTSWAAAKAYIAGFSRGWSDTGGEELPKIELRTVTQSKRTPGSDYALKRLSK